MQTIEASVNKKLKSTNLSCKMPQADTDVPDRVDGQISFTIEKIVQNLLPGYSSSTPVNFSLDDRSFDEDNLSEEEKFRRGRLGEHGLGVTSYEWVKTSSKKTTIMVPLPAGIYITDRYFQPQLKFPSDSSAIVDPHLSPDGINVAYVRNNELHALDLLYNRSKRLTSSANGTIKMHVVAEYIAQEEMDRKNGYWWTRYLDGYLLWRN